MKTFRNYILGPAVVAAMALGFASCQDDVDAPAFNVPKANVEPNTTILELKQAFWSDDTNYAKTIEDSEDPDHRYVIHGRVISSDEEGNVFKSLVIQDETAALAFSIDQYNLYQNYRVGQDIVLDVTGMEIGKYAGLQQIGRKSWYENGNTYQVSFMSLQYFQQYAQLDGLPERPAIDTLVMNTFGDINQTTEGLQKFQSQLVRFRNVTFTEGGQRTLSVYHSSENADQNTTIQDRNGSTLTVRTSGYCTFFNIVLPTQPVDIVGILSYYNSAWQLILIDGEGIIPVGEQPGTKEKPYTVEQAIEEQAAGISSNGWVKGYIVGAVAPEVEVVSSNDDIQWEAPTLLDNTLVIAGSATETDWQKCIVVTLPSGTAFQQYGNLSTNPANLGKEIMVLGNLAENFGTYGITGNTGGVSEFSIEGVVTGGGEIPAGDGQEATPYNVTQIVAMNPQSTTAAVASGVWVKGYIVGSMPTGGSSTTLAGTNFSTEDAATTNLVLAPTPDCTDASKCIGIQLPTSMRDQLALANQPGNLGKELAVKGDIMKYCGGPGVKNLTENKFEGGSDTPVTPPVTGDVPEGSGTDASPYNVAQIRALNPSSTTDAVQSGVWAKGYIVGSMPTGGTSTSLSSTNFSTQDAANTNLVLGPTADCTDPNQCITIQLPSNTVRSTLNLADNPGNLGKLVALKGDVMKYCGAAGLKNVSECVFDGAQPSTPSVDTFTKATSVTSGNSYLFVASNKYGALFDKNYGYMAATDCTGGDSFEAPASAALTFTAVSGGYNITTSAGKFLGAKDGYKTFDTTDDSANGRVWTVAFNADGTATITNVATGKIVYQDPQYGSFGCYTAAEAASTYVLPYLYTSGKGGNGGTTTPTEPTEPAGPWGDVEAGAGTESSPYNVDQIVALNPASTSDATESGVYVQGYVVGYMPSSSISNVTFSAEGAVASNVVLGPTPDCTDTSKLIAVQLPASPKELRDTLSLKYAPDILGEKVTIVGDVMKYCGGPGIRNTSKAIF
ncbi:MAG: hypothetical protein HDS65_00960 [Bacteroidales bacterium]|nr:hypothetical protein [Bacteroidales bacterium]